MEWIEGRTLRQLLVDEPMPLGQVLSIARQIVDGLAAAHAKGIIHRDLKPENIMLRDIESGGVRRCLEIILLVVVLQEESRLQEQLVRFVVLRPSGLVSIRLASAN